MPSLHLVVARPHRATALAAVAVALTGTSTASAKVVTTPIASYDSELAIAARDNDVAVVVMPDDAEPTISVGRGTEAPVPAEGVGPGVTPPVHFGTTASGATVLTYTRVQGSRSRLYAWDLRTHVETPVAGVGSRDVVEGVMDRGNVAYARLTGKTKAGFDTHRTLMYKPARGAARVLATQGGHDLALGSGGALQVVPSMASGSGLQTPILLQRVSLSGAVKTLRHVGVGEDFQQVLAPAFVGGGVQWLFTSLSGSTLYRQDAAGRTLQRRTGKVESAIAYTGASRAYAVRVRSTANSGMPGFDLVRLDGITFEAPRPTR